jgi:hypothetical protein
MWIFPKIETLESLAGEFRGYSMAGIEGIGFLSLPVYLYRDSRGKRGEKGGFRNDTWLFHAHVDFHHEK